MFGYKLVSGVAKRESQEYFNFPDHTEAKAHFIVGYFSVAGERFVETSHKFHFRVSDTVLVTWIETDARRVQEIQDEFG